MSTTVSVRDEELVFELKEYFRLKGKLRNHVMINLGLYTALRISDILKLKWGNVFDFNRNKFRKYIIVREKKTGKINQIIINRELLKALKLYKKKIDSIAKGEYSDLYIVKSQKGTNNPICRSQAFKIIKTAAIDLNIPGAIGCHSLRKTLGYWLWKSGVAPALIMVIYNHSSFEITKRYLCITQDEKDAALYSLSYKKEISNV